MKSCDFPLSVVQAHLALCNRQKKRLLSSAKNIDYSLDLCAPHPCTHLANAPRSCTRTCTTTFRRHATLPLTSIRLSPPSSPPPRLQYFLPQFNLAIFRHAVLRHARAGASCGKSFGVRNRAGLFSPTARRRKGTLRSSTTLARLATCRPSCSCAWRKLFASAPPRGRTRSTASTQASAA